MSLAETLANKIEYCRLVGDNSFNMKDFYRQHGIPDAVISDSFTIRLMEEAQNILRERAMEDGPC